MAQTGRAGHARPHGEEARRGTKQSEKLIRGYVDVLAGKQRGRSEGDGGSGEAAGRAEGGGVVR